MDRPKNNRFTVAVTTFNKNEALAVWLATFKEHCDFENLDYLVICDDALPIGEEVFKYFEPYYEGKLRYLGGERAGIAKNKNRGIKFFLEESDSENLLLFDDDIKFIGKGLEKRLLRCDYGHITGYLGIPGLDPLSGFGPAQTTQFSGLPFFLDFKPQRSNNYLWFCAGSQGVMLYFNRAVLDFKGSGVGYFDTGWPDHYGYEHSALSMRINKKFSMFPEDYCILKYCENYFITQEVANTYSIPTFKVKYLDHEGNEQERDVLYNQKYFANRRQEIYNGVGLVVKNPGV